MLQGFRKIINSFVGKVFFSILVATFGLLGVGFGIRDLVLGAAGQNDAASVAGTKITLVAFERAYRRQLSNIQRQAAPGFNPTPEQKQELARATLDQEINDAIYAKAARDAGFRVDDAMVRQITETIPAFAGEDKRFSQAHFRAVLASQGLSEAVYIDLIRRNVIRHLVTSPVAGSANPPKLMAEEIYRYRNERRVGQVVTITDAAATGIPAPTDAEIEAYYKKHAVDFTAPEYRGFTVLALTPDLFAGDVQPTEDELRAAYDSHKADYVVPERRKIEQVVVDDKAVAEAIAKAAQAGRPLADAAKAATAGKSQPVALDFQTREEYPETLRDPVFTAAKDAIVGPVQSPFGWHVIKVADIQPGHEVTFDQAKPRLMDEVKRSAATDKLAEQVDKLGDKLTGGIAMEDVAAGVNAKPVKIGLVDAKGEFAATPKDAAKPEQAWLDAAFGLKQGETTPFQEGKDGGYFAVRLDGVTPPALRPLAEVKPAIIAGWTAEQRAAQSEKRAKALAAEATAGKSMTEIAAKAGAELMATPAVTRDPAAAKGADAPPAAAVDMLFQLSKVGDIAAVPVPDGQAIVRLTEIRPADPLAADARLGPITQELTGAMQQDALAEYLAGLRDQTRIKINPDAMQTVAGQ